jgi:hydroxyacylglutathione hydrolase
MKSSVNLFIILLFLAATSTAQEPDTIKFRELSPEKFMKEFKDNADPTLIDLRYRNDYKKSRISGAVNVPFNDISENYYGGPDAIPIDKSLFLYCYVGRWSRKAAEMFYDHGYRNILSLEGGFSRWKSKKMPVEKKRIKT